MLDERGSTNGITPFKNGVAHCCPLYSFIRCTNGMVATLDPWNWIRLHNFTWYAKKSRGGWYAYRKYYAGGKMHFSYMHREITGCLQGFVVHHINGITLFNIERNLQNKTPGDHETLHKTRKIQRRLAG